MSRTARVIGEEAVNRLRRASVAVFGVGGVGGHLCEALARAGIGHITLIDKDVVSPSNLNRQLVALHSTLGKPKVQVMKERILDVNPSCAVETHEVFYLPENAHEFDLSRFDFIADAIDTVSAKIQLAVRAHEAGVPLIAAMGAGNKLYPERFTVADLAKTTTDPLARIMRRELSARGIRHLTVVYSDEIPQKSAIHDPETGKSIPGSLPHVPGVMGMIMAGEIIRRLADVGS